LGDNLSPALSEGEGVFRLRFKNMQIKVLSFGEDLGEVNYF